MPIVNCLKGNSYYGECIKLGEDKFQKHDAERCCGLSGCLQSCYFIDIVVLFCMNYVFNAANVFMP